MNDEFEFRHAVEKLTRADLESRFTQSTCGGLCSPEDAAEKMVEAIDGFLAAHGYVVARMVEG